MNPGNVLEIQLKASDHEPQLISNVSIDVVFFCGGRERYRFDAGTTDAEGCITGSYDLFEAIRKENQSVALMDYNTKLEDCDSVVVVRAPTLEELGQRLDALKKWFPDRVSAMSEKIRRSNNGKVDVREARVNISDDEATRVNLFARTLLQ